MSVSRITECSIPEGQLALGWSFRVERPWDTWIRCILPELTVQESHTQPLSAASQIPRQTTRQASSGGARNSFWSKNIHPSFPSLMLKILSLSISVFLSKSQIHKPEAWDPALQLWQIKYLFFMYKIWLIIPSFRSLRALNEMLIASKLCTYKHYLGGLLKVLIIRFPPCDSVDQLLLWVWRGVNAWIIALIRDIPGLVNILSAKWLILVYL